MGQVQFRTANRSDASALVALKRAAIEAIDTAQYTESQLTAWQPDESAVTDFERAIDSETFDVVVASNTDEIVAYGVLRPEASRIEAIFVHPDHTGCGIGRSLVRQLESRARMSGLSEIKIVASLNAKSFYESLSYWDFGRECRRIDGVELEFAIMRKVFDFDTKR